MDWPESTQPRLLVLPRGMARDGGMLGDEHIDDHPLVWTSTYASVVTSIYDLGTADGLNECGFAAHMLFFAASDYGPRDTARAGLHAGLWAQYLLDQADSVSAALELLTGFQLIDVHAHGRDANVHIALEDASGDSAIVECIDGTFVVHHGREFVVMTNDPSYDHQLALVANLDLSEPSSDLSIPGNVNPRDRFQRATYFASLLPEPTNEREAVAGVLAIARNSSVPFGAPYQGFGVYNTEYRTVCDLRRRRYHFELTTSPGLIWVNLEQFDLTPAGRPLAFDPVAEAFVTGDVTDAFTPTAAPY